MLSPKRLPDLITVRSLQTPDAVAHDDLGAVLTFGAWDRASREIGGGLAAAGLREGERVLLPISNRHAVAFAVSFMAVLRAGAISVPLSTRLKPNEVANFATLVGARWAITDIPSLLSQTSLERFWSVDDLPRALSALPDQDALDPNLPCDILPTSGTTGAPKGVVSTHADLLHALGDGTGTSPVRVMLQALPFTGSGGCHSIMPLPLKAGTTVITQPAFDPEGFLELIQSRRPDAIQAVPAMLRLIVDHPRAAAFDVSSLRWIFTGSAPLPHDTVERLAALWPKPRLINLYGLSEAGTGTQTRSRGSVSKPGSVGQSDDPEAIQIRDEDGARVARGETGEIWSRAPRPRVYWNDPQATAATWKDGWLRTGDLGFVDADGDLIICGRSKDLIIRGGYNIAPIEVEEALHAHPAVAEAGVCAIPHPVLGEDVAAAVVFRPGRTASVAELTAWCGERLADNKVPRKWTVLDELPKNQNGKVVKRELASRFDLPAGGA